MAARATFKPNGAKIREILLDRGMSDVDLARKSCITLNCVKRALRSEPVLQRTALQFAKSLHIDAKAIILT